MPTIEVIRQRPPELARCRGQACHRWIEWVTTLNGRRMPVDSPLLVERVYERDDGRTLAVIDVAASHFATCPASAQFRKRPRRG